MCSFAFGVRELELECAEAKKRKRVALRWRAGGGVSRENELPKFHRALTARPPRGTVSIKIFIHINNT